jgi:hypothetical protein
MAGSGVGALSAEASQDDLDDGLPRTDISPLLTDALLSQIGDDNWKERKVAIEAVEQALSEAGVLCVPRSVAPSR